MAEEVKVRLPQELGGQDVILQNAASEATMQRMLEVFEKFSGQKSDPGARQEKAKNTSAQKQNTQAVEKANQQIEDFYNELDKSNTSLTKFGNAAKDHALNLTAATQDLAGNILQGGDSFSMLSGIFETASNTVGSAFNGLASTIPFVGRGLGKLADTAVMASTAIAGFALAQFDNIADSFDQVAEVGATFGGQLMQLKDTATASRMSLTQFTNVIRRSSPQLAAIGGTVSSGARILGEVVSNVEARDRRALLLMGVNAEQLGDITAEFLAQQRYAGRLSLMSTEQASQGAVEFAKNLSDLSKLTGEDIDRLKQEQEQMRIQSEYASTLARFGDNIQGFSQNAAAFRTIARRMGPEFESVFQEALAFGQVSTRSNNIVMAANQEAGSLVVEAARRIRQGMDPSEAMRFFEDQLRSSAPGVLAGVESSAQMGQMALLGVQSELVTTTANVNGGLTEFFRRLDQAGSLEGLVTTINEERRQAAQGGDDLGDIVATFRERMNEAARTIEEEVINQGLKLGAAGINTAFDSVEQAVFDLNAQFKNLTQNTDLLNQTIGSVNRPESVVDQVVRDTASTLLPGQSFTAGGARQQLMQAQLERGELLSEEQVQDALNTLARTKRNADTSLGSILDTSLNKISDAFGNFNVSDDLANDINQQQALLREIQKVQAQASIDRADEIGDITLRIQDLQQVQQDRPLTTAEETQMGTLTDKLRAATENYNQISSAQLPMPRIDFVPFQGDRISIDTSQIQSALASEIQRLEQLQGTTNSQIQQIQQGGVQANEQQDYKNLTAELKVQTQKLQEMVAELKAVRTNSSRQLQNSY